MGGAPDGLAPAGQRAGASAYGLSTATLPGGTVGNSCKRIWGVSRERAQYPILATRTMPNGQVVQLRGRSIKPSTPVKPAVLRARLQAALRVALADLAPYPRPRSNASP
jgi:hypothetical protein